MSNKKNQKKYWKIIIMTPNLLSKIRFSGKTAKKCAKKE